MSRFLFPSRCSRLARCSSIRITEVLESDMINPQCKDPKWRRLIFALAVLLVLAVALFLYVFGLAIHAGWLYSLAVLVLVLFAVAGAIALAFLIYAILRRWCELKGAPPKGSGTPETSGPSKAHLPSTIYKKPDPLIYSQYFLMAQGLAFTWDNPDIRLTELPAPDGTMAPVASNSLAPNHVYRIHALVHNDSIDSPCVGMPVAFSYLTFGIGTISTPIGVTAMNLAVKGAVGEPSEAFFDWLTPATPGHYCIQVLLIWPDDRQPLNNLGQENTDVKKLNSPQATFQFPLRNDAAFPRLFRLEIDTYPAPVPLPCSDVPVRDRVGDWDPLAAHRRAAYPLPGTWSVDLSPAGEHMLHPGEEVQITAVVNVPEILTLPRPINIHAFADGILAGGVTLYIHS